MLWNHWQHQWENEISFLENIYVAFVFLFRLFPFANFELVLKRSTAATIYSAEIEITML